MRVECRFRREKPATAYLGLLEYFCIGLHLCIDGVERAVRILWRCNDLSSIYCASCIDGIRSQALFIQTFCRIATTRAPNGSYSEDIPNVFRYRPTADLVRVLPASQLGETEPGDSSSRSLYADSGGRESVV